MWIYSTPPCHSNIILQTCKWPPKANPNQRFWGLLVLCLKKIQRTVFPQNCFCLKASLVSGGRTKKGAEKLLNGQAGHWAENQDEWRRNKQGEPAAGNSMEWIEDKTHCSWEVCTCLKNNSGNLEEWLSPPSLLCFLSPDRGPALAYESPLSSLCGTDGTELWSWRKFFWLILYKACFSVSYSIRFA